MLGTTPDAVEPGVGTSYTEYVQRLREQLEFAYRLAGSKAGGAQKTYYDSKMKAIALEVGYRVLVRKVRLKGKQKLADRWTEVHVAQGRPSPSTPVYEVKLESSRGRSCVLHRNMLLPITNVPAPRQTLRPRAPQAEDAGAKVDVPVVDPKTDVQQNAESEDNRDGEAEDGVGFEGPTGDGPRNGERDEVICEDMDEEVELLPQLRRSNRVQRKPRWMDTNVYEFSQLSMDQKLHLLQSFISVLTE